jgi:hypothetical protein
MITDEIRENLPPLQADYTKVNGSPFVHFYCPLLCRDEDVEFCMGHIISKTIGQGRQGETPGGLERAIAIAEPGTPRVSADPE